MAVKLRFIHLITILCMYENSGEHVRATQELMTGKKEDNWDGLVNELMWSLYLLDDEGETRNPTYGEKLRSISVLARGVKIMRDNGIINPLERNYFLTDLGREIGRYLSQFNHYKDMPLGATIDKGTIKYGK